MNDDQAHRNLFIVAPGGETAVEVKVSGRNLSDEISLGNLPDGWVSKPGKRSVDLSGSDRSTAASFTLRPAKAGTGEIHAFDVIIQESGRQRIIAAQVLVADTALVSEAEQAGQTTTEISPINLPEASGASAMKFSGTGKLRFDLTAPHTGKYALWLRARWERQSSTRMALTLDKGKARDLRANAMIGFTNWTDPKLAHTKMFAHYGEQYGHWSWYRIPDVHLAEGEHRLGLSAETGACFDAVVLLPQNPVIDRAALNLFQNWNYAQRQQRECQELR